MNPLKASHKTFVRKNRPEKPIEPDIMVIKIVNNKSDNNSRKNTETKCVNCQNKEDDHSIDKSQRE